MDRIPATEEEKNMARKFYGQKEDEVELEIGSYAEDGVADDPIFKQALLDAQFRMRMQKEYAPPAEKYSQRYQSDINERLLNVVRRYSCSPAEAVVILIGTEG